MKKFIFFCLLFFIISTQLCFGQQVILLLIDRIGWQELATWQELLPNFNWLLTEGSLGLLNTRAESGTTPESTHLTIGAGSRAVGHSGVLAGYEADETVEKEKAAVVYARRMGKQATEESVLALEIGAVIRANEKSSYGTVPGSLGQALQDAGKKTAVLGCGDTLDSIRRPHVAIAMDKKGFVDYGFVSKELLAKDPLAPFGLSTDLKALSEAFRKIQGKADFIVIDIGDTSRVEEYRDYLTSDMLAKHRLRALQQADKFLGFLRQEVDWNDTLLLVTSPTPNLLAMQENRRLTPIIAIGQGFTGGLLTGPTTRRPAVVGNTDIAPTVLQALGIREMPQWSGRAFYSIPHPEPLGFLLKHKGKLVAQNQQRVPFNQTYVFYLIVVIVLATCGVFANNAERLSQKQTSVLQKLILTAMAVPAAALLLPALPGFGTWLVYPQAVLLSVLLAWLVSLWGSKRGLWLLSIITVAVLCLDILLSGTGSQYSFLGYSAIIGARYYGLGNEYMGVLIGAALVAAAGWLEGGGKKWPVFFFFLFVTALVGLPFLGANVGGTITAIAAFVLAGFRLLNVKLKWKQVFALGGLVVLAIALFAVVDQYLVSGSSHLGESVKFLTTGQWGQIFMIIVRKVSMNLRLIRFTIWTRVLLFFLAASIVIAIRPQGVLKRLFSRKISFASSFYAAALGWVAAFVFNDSGVVAAATLMIFPVLSLFFLLVEKES